MAITAEQLPDGTFRFHGRANDITIQKNKALEPFGKQVLNYGQVLRLLPTPEQAQDLNQQIGNARFVRNRYLEERIRLYQEKKLSLGVETFKKEYLPKLKEENPFLRRSDKFALEADLQSVDSAYRNFFSGRSGFPKKASRFKPNGNRYTTKHTNNNLSLALDKDGLPCIKLPKVGKVRIVLPAGKTFSGLCPSGTSIKKATINRQGDNYEVSLGMETVIDQIHPVEEVSVSDILSADMGLKDFAVLGDKEGFLKIRNPRWIKIHERRLRRFQKALSRKQYDRKTHTGSKNWYKAKKKVTKEQRKTADQRKDFQHKLSRCIADSCRVFVCEDLNIKGMMKNRHLSKAVASVGWYGFFQKVKYKLERTGGRFLQVSRWFPSSQTCSCCGYKNIDVRNLTVREWTCPECGSCHDRDGNAQQMILKEGIRLLKEMDVKVTM